MTKHEFYGKLLYVFFKLIDVFSYKKLIISEKFSLEDQCIVVFWHKKIITATLSTRIFKKKASILSPSKDGKILETILKKEGNELAYGSINKDNIKVLKELLRFVKNGYSLGIAVDGPKGPIFVPKPGTIFIAQKNNIPIVPLGSYTNKKWIFKKAWDRFEIPKFFSKNLLYIGDPFYVSKDMPMEDALEELTQILHKTNRIAYKKYDDIFNKNRKK